MGCGSGVSSILIQHNNGSSMGRFMIGKYFLTGVENLVTIHLQKEYAVIPALRGHSKKDKAQILMTNGSLIKVEFIAESILQYF